MAKDTLAEITTKIAAKTKSDVADWTCIYKTPKEFATYLFENTKTSQIFHAIHEGPDMYRGGYLDGRRAVQAGIELLLKKERREDVVAKLFAQADGLDVADQFIFAVLKEGNPLDDGYYAIVVPKKYWKETGACWDFPLCIDHLIPGAEDVNESGTFVFDEHYATATELTEHMNTLGFSWNKDLQQSIDASVIAELSPPLSAITETSIDTDAARNALADQVIARYMSPGDDVEDWEAYRQETEKLAVKAGKALANRHVFSIDMSNAEMEICITPRVYFDENGGTDSGTCLTDQQLKQLANAAEASWNVKHPEATTPLLAARYLQSLGFHWDKDYQKWTDKTLVKELSVLEPQDPKKVTSGKLKSVFTQFGGGDEKDWKRLSKKKNGEQQWVRVFENKKDGRLVEVVELGNGKVKARQMKQ